MGRETAVKLGTLTLKCDTCGASVKQTKLRPYEALHLIDRFYTTTCESGHLRESEEPEPGSPEYEAQTDAFLHAIGVEEPEQ